MKIKGHIGKENATILKITGMGSIRKNYFQCKGNEIV